jgi:transcriptional regulator with XRE-family HTH domain
MDVRGIGERVRAALRARGMNQREFADRLHVDPAVISRLVRGERQRPNLELLWAAAEVLDVSLDYLTGRNDALTGETADELSAINPSPDENVRFDGGGSPAEWRQVALALAESDRMRAAAELERAKTEHDRTTQVSAVAQRTMAEILQMFRQEQQRADLIVSHPASRTGSAAG